MDIDTSRRDFLTLLSLGLAFPGVPASFAGSPSSINADLTARVGAQRLDPELPLDTEVWGFNGQVPGPMLRVPQGEELVVRFRNELEQGSAVHWHGIRIDNAMDGVVGLTQPSVMPGEDFEYRFKVPDAGTYWYHAHQNSSEQVGRGLYGVLLVEESEPPEVDQDVTLALDDWRLDDTGAIHPSFTNLHDISHAGRMGNWLTVNGKGSESVTVRPGERVRLRLLNTANSLVMPLRLPDWNHWIMALDGMPLNTPTPTTDDLVLGPGQRIDIIVDVPPDPAEGEFIAFADRGGVIPLVDFPVVADTAVTPRLDAPMALTPNPVTLPGKLPDQSTNLEMRGGARGDLDAANYQGEMMSIRELVKHGKAWALNGVVDRTSEPLLTAPRGSTQEIVFHNRTAWPHAMHLHGYHFLVQDPDLPGAGQVLRDTVMVYPRESVAVKFVADNPGSWLVHCHMLEHQSGGMVTWIEVT